MSTSCWFFLHNLSSIQPSYPCTHIKLLPGLSSSHLLMTTTSFSLAFKKRTLAPLVSILNAAEKIVFWAHHSDHIIPLFASLQWLSRLYCNNLKLSSSLFMTYAYPTSDISFLIHHQEVSFCLPSAHDVSLRHPLVTFSNRHPAPFSLAAPYASEEFPINIHNAASLYSCKFSLTFPLLWSL